jgi:hypothetical protein
MPRKQNSPLPFSLPAAESQPRDLPPDRAFVLRLDASAHPPYRMAGRVEHITSGQVAHVASLQELVTFLATVLRNLGRAD